MPVAVRSVRVEYRADSSIVAVPRPRVSWTTVTEAPGWIQARAELEWSGDRQTAIVDGAESQLVAWPFAPLGVRERGQLRIRVTGEDGTRSPWSDPIDVIAGQLGEGEWRAAFIALPEPGQPAQPAWFRTEFDVGGPVRAATLYATAHGVYQAELNGYEVDDQILKPGWTPYQYRLIHETSDVTSLLRPGRNALGVSLAGGWFTERYGFRGQARPFYGEQPTMAAQLVLEYADGTQQVVVSGPDWRATGAGPIVSSGIYAGESFDARRRIDGWSDPGFDDRGWTAARVVDSGPTPSPRTAPPARAIEELPVREVLTSPTGRRILDFGQNLVGRLRIRASGPAGHTIVLRHAEVLEGGELCVRPLRAAEATDRYTLAGDGEEVWEPRFTFHGFRYAEVEGWPGLFDPSAVTAIVVHSDMARTGQFESSHPMVNRLHENIVWGMRGNFLHLPTDCPQRDERFGWTGDIQVFAPAATRLYDCDGFLASWLADLALEQRGSGGVPFIVPDVLASAGTPAAAWGDAATVVPWILYDRYRDLGVLSAQFASMRAWVDQLVALTDQRGLWQGGFQFGDWLDPAAPADQPGEARTDPDLIANAYLFRSAQLTAAAATVLGDPGGTGAPDYYTQVAERVRRAWLDEYMTPAKRLVSDTQTAYALAIVFEIPTYGGAVERMGERLAWLVRRAGYRIGTGFVGTPLIQDALVRTGHAEVAARLLLQTECPSWLYPVTMGATTVWERWDSVLPDGSVNPGQMTSFNHYAFGSIADWLHRVVAGLSPLAPGYRRIGIAPNPLPGLEWAGCEHETPYGRAAVRWQATDGAIRITATVPPNTHAQVNLPDGGEAFQVGSGTYEWIVKDPRSTPPPRRLSLESPLSEIIDDTEAYEAIWRALHRRDPRRAHEFRYHTAWVAERALSDVLPRTVTPPEMLADLEAALAELNTRRAL
jgi:alpha-L-rhamnosidase